MTVHTLYGGDVELSFDKGEHEYQVEGERVASVTQILRVLSKPALKFWAAKLASLYWLAEIKEHNRRVRAVLNEAHKHSNEKFRHIISSQEDSFFFDEVQLDLIDKAARAEHTKKSTKAMKIGDLVHDYAEKWGRFSIGTAEELPTMPINKVAQKAIEGFLDWTEKHEVEFLETEFKVYSKTWNYCGTVDLDAVIDGKRTLLDYKTGTGGRIYPESFFQSAAYAEARADEREYIGDEEPDYDQRATLCFDREKGTFKYKTRDMGVQFETDFKVFRGCLLASQGLQELKDEN